MTSTATDREAFLRTLSERTEKINKELLRFLPEETGMQRLILEACNYSVENGGKRIRPILMEAAYFLCRLAEEKKKSTETLNAAEGKGSTETSEAAKEGSETPEKAENTPEALYLRCQEEYESLLAPFLAAIEMIHSSSLVHDDLPCMDNDRLRRGKLSTWAKYGVDMGTLAGDGLMIYAFETACKAMQTEAALTEGRQERKAQAEAVQKKLSQAEAAQEISRQDCVQTDMGERALRVVRAIEILAQKTGIFGMIGGQTVDVALTGSTPNEKELDFIYRLKTGALLEASVMIGAVLAGAGDAEIEKLRLAASELGMAFQIKDDILDETESSEALGKTAGSDERNQKMTYAARFGIEQAKADAQAYTDSAKKRIREIADYPFFEMLCSYLMERRK